MNRATKNRMLAPARQIIQDAEAEGRGLTSTEKNAVQDAIDAVEFAEVAEKATYDATPATEGMYSAFKSAGFPAKRATIDSRHLYKTASFSGDVEQLNPTRREGTALGHDRRYLADVLPVVSIGSDVTAVQVLRQVSRTLPSAASVQRELMATTEKAEVGTVRELISSPVGMLAVKESGLPDALISQEGMRSTIETDLRLAILEARDAAIVSAINAASPANAGAPGTDLIERVRYAIAAMQESGYDPSVLALSPSDAADFDLMRSSGPEEFYVFGPGNEARSPFGMKVVASKSVTTPLLIDPQSAGRRYEGSLSLERFPENDGATNTSLVRLEMSFLCAIERPAAIRRVVSGS